MCLTTYPFCQEEEVASVWSVWQGGDKDTNVRIHHGMPVTVIFIHLIVPVTTVSHSSG